MTTVRRSALVNYSAEQMYHLVNDVAAYPQYMNGCVGAEIIEQSASQMVARLDVSKAGLTQSFTTRNTLKPHNEILLSLEDGPFSSFQGAWRFEALKEDACKVVFELEFDVKRKLLKKAVDMLFKSVAGDMVDSLTKRASEIYGH